MTQLLAAHAAVQAAAARAAKREAAAKAAAAAQANDAAQAGGTGAGSKVEEGEALPLTEEGKVDLEALYPARMKGLVVKYVTMGAGKSKSDYSSHHYTAEITAAGSKVARKVIRHVKTELRGMKQSLPCYFGSSVLLRADKARPYIMRALIFAPHDTPYDSGAFVFDIFCGPTCE